MNVRLRIALLSFLCALTFFINEAHGTPCTEDQIAPDWREVGGECLPSCQEAENISCQNGGCDDWTLFEDAASCADTNDYEVRTLTSFSPSCCLAGPVDTPTSDANPPATATIQIPGLPPITVPVPNVPDLSNRLPGFVQHVQLPTLPGGIQVGGTNPASQAPVQSIQSAPAEIDEEGIRQLHDRLHADMPAAAAADPQDAQQWDEVFDELDTLSLEIEEARQERAKIIELVDLLANIIISGETNEADATAPSTPPVCSEDKIEPDYRAVGNRCLPSCEEKARIECEENPSSCSGFEWSNDTALCSNTTDYLAVAIADSYESVCCLAREKTDSEKLVDRLRVLRQ